MPSRKLVRCEIGRPGRVEPSLRYVPLEIFGLWRYLMTHRHQFEIRSAVPSLWVELAQASSLDLDERRVERVSELRLFVLSERYGMLSEVHRYLPAEDVETVRPVLLRHYGRSAGSAGQEERWRELPGVWFRPRHGEDLEHAAPEGAASS